QPGNQREQVTLSCAVVSDDENAFSIGRRLDLKIGNHQIAQLLGHSLRDDERLDELPHGIGRTRLFELDDGLNWLELNQVAISHGDVDSFNYWLLASAITIASICLNWMNSG